LDAGQGQALVGPGHGQLGRGSRTVGAGPRRAARRRRDLHRLPRPRQALLTPVLRRTLPLLAGAAGLLGAGLATPAPVSATSASYAVPGRPAVVETKVIGRSVNGRAIVAYRVGDPESPNKAVAMSTMHGNEPHTRRILASIRDGRPVTGVDLWLLPVVNPDGLARHTRKNAHGVDLNRNYPYHWRDLDGSYESGPGPASEPETRALMAFFDEVRPRRVVSFHQPLHGVDVST